MQRRFGNRLVEYALTLGPGGRIAEKQERVGHRKAIFAYEYDGQGRLARVFRDGRPEEEYGYDAQGRRVRDWTRQRGRRSLAYDNAGRLRRAGDAQFYYGQDNTLACCSDRQGSLHLTYGRNLGLLSLHDCHGRAVNFRNNQSGQPLEKHSRGEVFETFRWLDPLRLAEYRARDRGCRLVFHYQGGQRLPQSATFSDEEGSRSFFFGYDQVGSLKAVGDERGELIKTIDYDSFGAVLGEDWPWLFIPIGFAGGLRDRDTGFVRFGHRDYDPDIGRFAAQDPPGDTGGDHDLYEYCVDDPVNAVDPKGLADVPFWARLVGKGPEDIKRQAPEFGYDMSQCSDEEVKKFVKALPQSEFDDFVDSYRSRPDADAKTTPEQDKSNAEELRKEQNFLDSWYERYGGGTCIQKKSDR